MSRLSVLRHGSHRRHLVLPLVVLLWLAVGTQARAQTVWVIPGIGDWYLGANWSAAVPTAADATTIDNGGTAVADRGSPLFTADPATGGLDIGLRTDPAMGPPFATGAAELVDLDLSVGANLNVGVVDTVAGLFDDATGSLSSAAGGSAQGNVQVVGQATVGAVTAGPAGAIASGTIGLSGSLSGSGVEALIVGQAAAGGTASGSVSVVGDVSDFRRITLGQTNLLSTGDATGDLTVGGAVITNESPVTTFSISSQAGDGAANGTAQIASGIVGFVDIAVGSGSTQGAPGAGGTGLLDVLAGGISASEGFLLAVGATNGDGNLQGTANINGGIDRFAIVETGVIRTIGAAGTATGLLDVTGGDIIGRTGSDLTVGRNQGDGIADGTVSVVGGVSDFRRITVGQTGLLSTGDATGDLTTGGALITTEMPGTSINISTQAGDGAANGTAQIAMGITGYLDIAIGSGSTDGALGAGGIGQLDVLAGGISVSEGSLLSVGTTNGDGNLQGTVNVNGGIDRFDIVQTGVIRTQGAAGNATGLLNVTGGGITGRTTGTFTIGQSKGTGDAHGTVNVAGGVSDFRRITLGQTGLLSTGDATGDLTTGGAVVTNESPVTTFSVSSQAGDGTANGTAQIAMGIAGFVDISIGSGSTDGAPGAGGAGQLDVLAGGIAANEGFLLSVGTTNGDGNLQGTLNVSGGIDRFAIVETGVIRTIGAAGNATGLIDVTGGITGRSFGNFTVGQTAGSGNADGSVQIAGDLAGFQALVIGHTELGSGGTANGLLRIESGTATATSLAVGIAEGPGTALGTIDLDRTLVDLTADLTLGPGSHLVLHLDGLVRGLEYSALGAATAVLDGALDVLFEFLPTDGVHHFDLIRGDNSANAITGDFDPGSVAITGLPPTYTTTTAIVTDLVNGQPTAIYRLTVASAGAPVIDIPTLGSSSLLGLALLLAAMGCLALRWHGGGA